MTDKNKQKKEKDEPVSKPDPETLNTTDPQEHMKGPVSSFMHNIEKEVEKNDKETKEQADRRKDENT
jgi:hypothetical protein